MKISGSHTETIQSVSKTLFAGKESGTMSGVTSKLSKQGKHVINIIHGTPHEVLGTWTKDIIFLWEADDEDPIYIKHQEYERKERARLPIQKEIDACQRRINELNKLIEGASKSKMRPGFVKATIFFLLVTLFFLYFAIISQSGRSMYLIAVFGFGSICAVFFIGGIYWARVDASAIEDYKLRLKKEENLLEQLKEKYRNV